MENCEQKADIILETNYDKKEFLENILEIKKEFPNETQNCSFGDVIVITKDNQEIYYFIGKGGHLIQNELDDYNEVIVPYEITQYLKDATNKYSELDYSGIYLRFDDQFLKKNLGDCQPEWNYRYFLLNDDRTLIVEYPPNNKKIFKHHFDIFKTTSQDIHNFYTYSFSIQFKFLLKYKLEGQDYDRFIDKYGDLFKHPEIPAVWTSESYGSTGGHRAHYGIMSYQGPVEFKNKIIEIIKDFYEGFDYEFIWER